jgi:hypothetical protein
VLGFISPQVSQLLLQIADLHRVLRRAAADLYAANLYEFDPADLRWRALNSSTGVAGKAPSARSGHGFAAMGGELYLFGGTDRRDLGTIVLGGGLVGATTPSLSTLSRFLACLSERARSTFVYRSAILRRWLSGRRR